MKLTVTVTYTIYYVIDFASNYGFTKCKRCFNLKTSREIKQVLKSNCIGYNINGKFYSLTKLRKQTLTKHKIAIDYIHCYLLLKLRFMKRYLAFFGVHYYPSGGMDDFLNDFDTIEECKNAIDNRIKEGFNPDLYSLEEHIQYQWEYSWAHIYDTETQKEVWSK